VTVTTFWLAEAVKPATAWRLLATLNSASFALTPVAFRTEAGLPPRRLGRRAEAMVVERLSAGAYVELLGRTGQFPRILLRSTGFVDGYMLTLFGPPVAVPEDVMTLVEFIKHLYELFHPAAGRADVVRGSEAESIMNGKGQASKAATPKEEDHRLSGWLSVLSPRSVEQVGAARLLMAPVYLIEMLSDGGLLVVDTPMPLLGGQGAGRRSPATLDHLQEEGVDSTGAPDWLENKGRSREAIPIRVPGPTHVRERLRPTRRPPSR
jgi:hypothetical protein